MDASLARWLTDADPSLVWQVQRDLLHEPDDVWRAARPRGPRGGGRRAGAAREGFGARLLALQDADGQWAGGAFFPADASPDEPGQPWTATTWSLTALREWGVPASALGDTADRLEWGSRWEYEDLPYWDGEVDVCINAWTLMNGQWLGRDMGALAAWFPAHQLADGGWNCEWVDGATRSSFHSTLNALDGLLADEEATGGTPDTRAARRRGAEYLLERHLFRRRSTGEPVGEWVTDWSMPFRWRYNLLRALDWFRRASLLDAAPPDPRLAEAVDIVRAARRPDGTWLQHEPDPGRTWFPVDAPAGEPSRGLTLVGTRVLDWWEDTHPQR